MDQEELIKVCPYCYDYDEEYKNSILDLLRPTLVLGEFKRTVLVTCEKHKDKVCPYCYYEEEKNNGDKPIEEPKTDYIKEIVKTGCPVKIKEEDLPLFNEFFKLDKDHK